MDASLDRWLSDAYRVGLTEFRALTLVSRASDKELRVNGLAQQLGLSQSSVTRLVSRLEAKGYVRRDVCADDGRGVYAVITEQGEGLVKEGRAPYEARIADLLSKPSTHFPDLDTKHLGDALRKIETQLES